MDFTITYCSWHTPWVEATRTVFWVFILFSFPLALVAAVWRAQLSTRPAGASATQRKVSTVGMILQVTGLAIAGGFTLLWLLLGGGPCPTSWCEVVPVSGMVGVLGLVLWRQLRRCLPTETLIGFGLSEERGD